VCFEPLFFDERMEPNWAVRNAERLKREEEETKRKAEEKKRMEEELVWRRKKHAAVIKSIRKYDPKAKSLWCGPDSTSRTSTISTSTRSVSPIP